MTREEKINQLNDIFAEINEDDNLTSEDKIIEWKKDFKEYVNSLSMPRDDYKGIMEYIYELPVTSELCEDAISRKEALEALEQEEPLVWCDGADEIAAHNQWKSDVDTIKNMPTVQTKPIECSDAISRKRAVDAVADLFEISEYPHPYPQGKPIRLREIKEKLKQLPPVQPKPKTGHWIDDEFGSKCSCCGIHTHLDKFDKPMKFKYCSMCGAKMVEPQESETINCKSTKCENCINHNYCDYEPQESEDKEWVRQM